MELLKFNDSPKSPRRAKNPAGFIGAGIMVAVMGLSSTLAGTISISGGTVEFGQGVVTAAACDSSITITPISRFNASTNTFTVDTLTITGLDASDNTAKCGTKALELRGYASTTALEWRDGGTTSSDFALVLKIPAAASAATSADYFSNFLSADLSSKANQDGNPGVSVTGTNTDLTITVTNLGMSSTVDKFTAESRAARTSPNESSQS